jgi:hypothetical protein
MQLRLYFYDWRRKHVLGVLGIGAMVAFILFAWTNIGGGPSQEVKSRVMSVGMDTGTKMTLPRYMASIKTESGETALVEIPKSELVKVGEEVVVRKSPRIFTRGHEFQFVRKAE